MNLRRKWVLTFLGLWAAVLSLGGCARPWEAYQQIELGKPLPKGHLLLRKGVAGKGGRVWFHSDTWLLPAVLTKHYVSVLQDDAGNVTGKAYRTLSLSHCVVVQSASHRSATELQIPAQVFREPALDRRESRAPPEWHWELHRLRESLEPLAKEAVDDSAGRIIFRPTYGFLAKTEPESSFGVPISKKRLAEHIRKKLTGTSESERVPVTLGKDVDLSGLPDAGAISKARVKAWVSRGSGKSAYMVVWPIFQLLPERELDILDNLCHPPLPQHPDEKPVLDQFMGKVLGSIYMCHALKFEGLRSVSQYPEALLGITRKGFDWQYTGQHGGTVRIRNLGDRRIRIESKDRTLSDPLGLVLFFTFVRHDDKHLYKTVLARLTHAIQADPNNAETYLCRGATYAQAGHWDKALADLERAETLDRDNVKVRRAHKAARREADAYYKIIAHFRRRLSWGGDNTDVFTFLERRYRWSEDGRGVRDFTRAIQLHADSPTGYLNRGVCHYLKGRYAQGEADFSKAIEMNPKDGDAYCYRAYTRARRGRWQAARADVDACRAVGGTVEKAFLKRLRRKAPARW